MPPSYILFSHMNPILMHKLAPGLAFLQIVFVRHVLRTVRASNLAFTRAKAITFNTRVTVDKLTVAAVVLVLLPTLWLTLPTPNTVAGTDEFAEVVILIEVNEPWMWPWLWLWLWQNWQHRDQQGCGQRGHSDGGGSLLDKVGVTVKTRRLSASVDDNVAEDKYQRFR